MKRMALSILAALSIGMVALPAQSWADAAVSTGINTDGPSWPIGGGGWHGGWNHGWHGYTNNHGCCRPSHGGGMVIGHPGHH